MRWHKVKLLFWLTVWERDEWERHLILKDIAEHVLSRHLFLPKENVAAIVDQLDFSLCSSKSGIWSFGLLLIARMLGYLPTFYRLKGFWLFKFNYDLQILYLSLRVYWKHLMIYQSVCDFLMTFLWRYPVCNPWHQVLSHSIISPDKLYMVIRQPDALCYLYWSLVPYLWDHLWYFVQFP